MFFFNAVCHSIHSLQLLTDLWRPASRVHTFCNSSYMYWNIKKTFCCLFTTTFSQIPTSNRVYTVHWLCFILLTLAIIISWSIRAVNHFIRDGRKSLTCFNHWLMDIHCVYCAFSRYFSWICNQLRLLSTVWKSTLFRGRWVFSSFFFFFKRLLQFK